MSLDIFLRSCLIGFSIAAPVGPIGMLVIRRTVAEGRANGMVTGLGAAAADALYGAVGAFGLSVLASTLLESAVWLRFAGGLFLAWLGLRTLLARPAKGNTPVASGARAAAFASTFALTLANPLTMLSFAAVFAAVGLESTSGAWMDVLTVVSGVFAGSALWWLSLSGVVGVLRHRLTPTHLLWVNRISGALLLAYGVKTLSGG